MRRTGTQNDQSRRSLRGRTVALGVVGLVVAGVAVAAVLVLTDPFGDAQDTVVERGAGAGGIVSPFGGDAGLDEETIDQLRGAVGRAAGGAEAGGTVAWIDVPAGQLGLAAGMAHIADERLLTGAEAFHIGSVTKMVTATVALQLVEEGMLALEESIAEVIPEQAARFEHGDQITLRQLLGHTSGLPDFLDREFDRQLAEASSVEDGVLIRGCSDPDQAELLDYAASKSARFEPGTRGEYSSTNYVLVGKAIEAVTGQPLEAVYRERVFEPLDMTDTWLTCAEQPRTRIAHGYEPHPERSPFAGIDAEVLDLTDFEKPFVSAAGGLVSTGKDMAVFARALFTGELFNDDATLQAMREPHPLTSQGGPERPYGLGLEIDEDGIGHSGGLPGYNTQLRYYPDPDIVVVALGNQIAPPGPPPSHAAVSAIRTILVDNDTVTTPADDADMRDG